ncbi:cold-shock protein [Streptomyces sp. NPDC047813]|uniref:cold-shock protein n=1 Tax=Streptomyces sp. NPDC047813 TaxID=3154608 RepID=UPI0033DB37DE
MVNFGTVKWFNAEKGFGFITPDTPGPDLFVHYTDIIGPGYKTLREGERVEYQIEQGPKGPRAVDVIPLG